MNVDIDPLAGPDAGNEGQRLAQFWKDQIDKVKDDARFKRWLKRGDAIEKRYRDERSRVDEEGGARRYNALWSNVEILKPAIYGKCPVPMAERRFKDKDVVGRGAAQILERGLRNEIEICGFDEAMQNSVCDYLIAGRGTVWVRYEPEVGSSVSVANEGYLDIDDSEGDIEEENESPEENKLRETGDQVLRESVQVDYIHWQDFYTFPFNARNWKEVVAVAKRVYMTREQLKDRFGPIVGKDIPLKRDDRGQQRHQTPDDDSDDKGEIYEIWSLMDKSVFWVAEGYDFLCDRKDDPLQLENFFPCPRPIYSNATTSTLIPVPDYQEYQDQALQIDELTQRIAMLAKACKVAGVYNAAAKDIQRLLNEAVENELIPVDDWAAFAEKGGVAGNISMLPLKEIIGVINELMMVKDKCVLEMDRLTGITDIMRGTTDGRETMGAQRLKSNSAGTRLQRRQNEVARFARDTVRIMADIMSQHFSPLSLIEVSGALYEEGLGDIDMPSLTALQGLNQPQPPQQQLPPPVTPPTGAAGPGPIPGGPPPGAGPGTNVVPFKPPMPPTPPMPPGMPPGQMGAPPMPPEMQAKMAGLKRIADSIGLIRNEKLRGFRVDIEVDSTIYGDVDQEKTDRTQFIQAVTQYLQSTMPIAAQLPEITPLLGKFLQFGVRGFRVGRDLEAAIEEFCDEATDIAKQKAAENANKPNPALIKVQNDGKKAEAAMLTAQAKAKQSDAATQLNQMKTQQEGTKAQAEVQRQQMENQGEAVNAQMDIEMKKMDMQMRILELEIEKIRAQAEVDKIHAARLLPQVPPQEASLGNQEPKPGVA